MANGKIYQFLKDHWRGAILVIGIACFCASCLFCCKNGVEFFIKGNKITITKTKTK